MKQSRLSLTHLLLFALAALLLGTSPAQAKRVPKLYTFGPANSEVGPIKMEAMEKLPPELRLQFEALRVDTVGFYYKHFGLFWLDIWSWGGKWTVYNSMTEIPVEVTPSEAAALLGIKESELSKPLSYHLPWGLVIIVGLILLKIVPRLIARRKQTAAAAAVPQWSPPSQPAGHYQPPGATPAAGPPPMPPPLPPEQR